MTDGRSGTLIDPDLTLIKFVLISGDQCSLKSVLLFVICGDPRHPRFPFRLSVDQFRPLRLCAQA
jgi:hypothetical protein